MKTPRMSVAAMLFAAALNLQAASSIWLGTNSPAWTNALNWSPGIPADGDDVVIADTTGSGNALSLADSRSIGSLTFGTTGTRTTAFAITNTVAANSLTMTNGLVANGSLGGVINFFRIPTIISADQTWSIGGTPGGVTVDSGIGVTPRANGTQTPFTLNANFTKTGSGQLTFIGANITGNGNLTINQGVVKFNGGSSTTMSASGGGSIIINSGGKLMLFRNSAAVTCTKPITLNAGGTLEFGGNNTGGATYGFPLTLSGNVTFSSGGGTAAAKNYILTGAWTGTSAINGTAVGSDVDVLVLSNNISGWTGSFNNAGNGFRIDFSPSAPGNAAVAWSLNNAGAVFESLGPANIDLGSLGGNSGTLRNSNPGAVPVVFTVGALNTSTTFGGTIVDNVAQLSLVKIGSGSLTLNGNSTFTGGINVSNGAVLMQNATANAGSGVINVHTGASFGGAGNALGGVNLDASALIRADGGLGAPPLNVGTLNLGANPTDITTSQFNVYGGGKISAGGTVTLNGTNIINIVGAAPAVGVYDLIQYPGGSIGGSGFAGFQLGTLPFGVVANLQDSGTAVQLNVTAVTIEPGVWVGNVLSQWNLDGGLEWKGTPSGNAQPYHDLDVVYFVDGASSFNVNITTNVTPAAMTVSNNTTYTFSGVGGIVGSTPLFKTSPGTLIIGNSNNFTSGTYITNGTVIIGDGNTNGSLSGTVVNDGIVAFNRTDAVTLAGGVMSGAGSVEQRGSGRAQLNGANTYLGLTLIKTGTLAPGNGSSFGDTNSPTVVSNAATLDVNSQALGMEPIIAEGAGVGGNGAIVNNGGADQTAATRYVTLNNNTIFGGFRRWDIRNPDVTNDVSGGINAFLHGNNHSLTKVGTNIVAFISVGDTALADISIQGGTLTFSRSTTMGDSSKTVAVYPGATLQFHRTSEFINPNPMNKVVMMTNAALAVEGSGLTNLIVGPITMSGSNTISLPASTGLNLQGNVSGNSSITTIGTGAWIISGNCTHTGGTTIGGGLLQVDGLLNSGSPIVFTAAASVGGNGTILDAVNLPAGGAIAPGDSIGRLTISNVLDLSASAVNVFEINKDLGTNDLVRGMSSVTYGGTLSLVNLGSAGYAPGDSFKLFDATSYSGSFSSITPAAPALGLVWVTSNLTVNGTLSIAATAPVPLIVHSASSLVTNAVNVIFSAALDSSTAQNPANYTMSTSNQIISATLVNGTNVVLGLDSELTNSTFTVHVQTVQDMAYIPNVVAPTNVPGIALGYVEAFRLGNITNGYAFAYGTNGQIKIQSDGSDIFGTADNGEFVYKIVTGDFDVSVRLESLLITDPAAKAGIMVREMTDLTFPLNNDREYLAGAFSPDPARNNNFSQFREAQGGTSTAPAAPRPPANYPNNWLRLKRTGTFFQAYAGPNGLDWTPMTPIDTVTNPYPATVRLGLAATSHNAAQTTEAVFSNFGPATERGVLTIVHDGSNVAVSWQAGLVGAKLQSTGSVTPPSSWTDVPGSTTTNLVYIPIGLTNTFFRLQQ